MTELEQSMAQIAKLDNHQRIKDLQSLVLAWERFSAQIPECFREEILFRLRNTMRMYQCELNCLMALNKSHE